MAKKRDDASALQEALDMSVWDVQPHLVVPGRDAVKALIFIQQVDGLTQKTGENKRES